MPVDEGQYNDDLKKALLKASIDWTYLKKGKGVRKVENVLQVVVGRVLLWLSIVVELGIVFSEILQNKGLGNIVLPNGFSGTLFWFFSFVFIYALYLLRNRENFLDERRKYNFYKLTRRVLKGKSIDRLEIVDYMNHNSIWLFDYIINVNVTNYLAELFDKLMKLSRPQALLARMGLIPGNLNVNLLEERSLKEKDKIIEQILRKSFIFAYEVGMKYLSEEAVMYIFLEEFLKDQLLSLQVLEKDLVGIRVWLRNEARKNKYVEDWKSRVSIKPKSTVNRAYTSRFTPTLNQHARDFTQEVIKGGFKVSIAREIELDHMVNILEKGEKSAVLVVGEPGVGKTTLIKSLAIRMVVEDVPPKLQDMRLVGFDFNKAFSGAENIEAFKQVLHNVFEEVSQSKNVVLVLDNVNQMLNLRSEISGEIANIIVDAFDTFTFRMIATTDSSQLARFIRPHRALAGMFAQVRMEEPSDEIAMQIVMDEVPGIENEYNVKVGYGAIKAAVELSHKFAYDRVLPDKAIDIIKETVVSFKHLAGKKPLEYDEVAKVVSSKVGVSLGSITQEESKKLSRLEKEMHQRVVGQNEAIESVSGALRRARSGLNSSGRPIASFLFYGPTGVGKTEVAKTVADVYYGSEERMVRIDMSEYHEEENLNRLIGFTSDNGAFEGGFLTEPVHTNPFSLVLLDEIDKANPKVLDLFLQVLDEGYLDDGLGRKVDFSNTIIIATSNAGSSKIAELIEQGKSYEEVNTAGLEQLKKVFRIEFLNRYDKVIMFRPLTKEEVKLVARKFVEHTRLKLLDKGIKLSYADELLERLATLGYNPVFGAREMRRIVQDEVENKVADMIVRGEVRSGGEVNL
ncbi:MAG: ATP-dependent Clp protease ATP-binding subunit [Candidatus Dojkabacteria bacterium]|nr:ATP-dependent Clp protease ATP-binding subunit [Candidatus Dojkabacteria bacterium]